MCHPSIGVALAGLLLAQLPPGSQVVAAAPTVQQTTKPPASVPQAKPLPATPPQGAATPTPMPQATAEVRAAVRRNLEASATRRVEVARRAVAAMNGRDLAAWRQTVSPTHLWTSLDGDPRERVEGRANLARALEAPTKAIPDLTITPQRVLVGRHFVAIQSITSGTEAASRQKVGADSFMLTWTRGDEIRTTVAYLAPDRIARQVKKLDVPVAPGGRAPEVVKALPDAPLKQAALGELEKLARFVAGEYLAAAAGSAEAHRYLLAVQAVPPPPARLGEASNAIKGLSSLEVEAEEVLPVGDRVLLLVRITGVHSAAIGPVTASGRKVDVRVAIVAKMVQGRLADFQFYGDADKLAAQLRR